MQTKLNNGMYLYTHINDEGGYTSDLIRYSPSGAFHIIGTIIHTTRLDKYYNSEQEQHKDALKAYA